MMNDAVIIEEASAYRTPFPGIGRRALYRALTLEICKIDRSPFNQYRFSGCVEISAHVPLPRLNGVTTAFAVAKVLILTLKPRVFTEYNRAPALYCAT